MSDNAKKQYSKPILILATLLVLPGFLYYILTLKGENRYRPLPVFGPKYLSGTYHSIRGKKIPDTIYHRVTGVDFLNQAGNRISDTSYLDKIKVMSFFYGGCEGGCKRVLRAISRADSNYSQNPIVQFVSMTVVPQKDTQDTLAIYAKRYHAKPNKWDFVAMKEKQTDSILQQGFRVDGGLRDGKPFVTNRIVLLDNQNRIRGYYDGTFKPDLDRLNDEIKVLIVEQLRNVKDLKK